MIDTDIISYELQNHLLNRLSHLESSNNKSKVNRLGYVGKYQFGAARLEDLGYIKIGCYKKYKNRALTLNKCWTNKNGVSNLQSFLINENLQDLAALESLSLSYQRLVKKGLITPKTSQKTLIGLLVCSHLVGSKGTEKFYRYKMNISDANGTTALSYFKKGTKLYKEFIRLESFLKEHKYVVQSSTDKNELFEGIYNLTILLGVKDGKRAKNI